MFTKYTKVCKSLSEISIETHHRQGQLEVTRVTHNLQNICTDFNTDTMLLFNNSLRHYF